MLHAAIRGLNTAADLEILQMFTEKHFSENDSKKEHPVLLEILYLEEEILRQKLLWREKYESVIGNWIWPQMTKSFQVKKQKQKNQNVKISNSPLTSPPKENSSDEKSHASSSTLSVPVEKKNDAKTTFVTEEKGNRTATTAVTAELNAVPLGEIKPEAVVRTNPDGNNTAVQWMEFNGDPTVNIQNKQVSDEDRVQYI